MAGVPADDSTLTVNWPPSRAAAEYAGNRGYLEVTITRPHKSFFAGIVGLAIIRVSAAAVAANDTGAAGSSSLVALNDTACSAAKIHGGGGTGGLYIFPATGVTPGTGGYVQVNSICGDANGADDSLPGRLAGRPDDRRRHHPHVEHDLHPGRLQRERRNP